LKGTEVRKLAYIGTLVILFSFVSSGPLFAANPPPNIPPGQDAGSQDKRFMDESGEIKARAERKRAKPSKVEIGEQKEQPFPAVEVSFVLTDIKITGVTFFKAEDLRPIYQPYLQKKVTFKGLQAIAEAIKAKYHAKGYLTTNVYFPEQESATGVVEIISGRWSAAAVRVVSPILPTPILTKSTTSLIYS
jgi:hemolysin activation/secretion protein